jgi:hypothetical protein
MEQEKIFVLTNKRTFKRSVNIFVFDSTGKLEKRNIVFTTEHLIDKSQRSDVAQTVAAQYFVKNDAEANGLMANSGYGKTFVRIDDPEGQLKLPTRFVSPDDAEKAALKILFDKAGLEFNPAYDTNVLKKEYEIYVSALAGTNKVAESKVKEIPANPVDFDKSRREGILAAKAKFEEKYGYPVPDVVINDLAFYDGLSNPDFPAEEYISNKQKSLNENVNTAMDANEKTKEKTIGELQKAYFDKFGRNVANAKKNDATWIKGELAKE